MTSGCHDGAEAVRRCGRLRGGSRRGSAPRGAWAQRGRPGGSAALHPVAGGGRPQERRLRQLPHQDRRARRMHNAPSGAPRAAPTATAATSRVQGGGQPRARTTTRRRSARRTCSPRTASSGSPSANPERAYTALLDESLDFVRFVNPGDLRAAPTACGPCHSERGAERLQEHDDARRHALRRRALQQRRAARQGRARRRELRARRQAAHAARRFPPPTPEETRDEGRAARPRARSRAGSWASPATRSASSSAAGAAGSRSACPIPFEEPGKPDKGLSPRGLGTLNRTDPVILGAQKTRLLDPLLSLLGTNDHPGDYRSSGCTRLPRRLRERPLAGELGAATRPAGNRGFTADRGPDDPEGRGGPPAEARLHPRHPVEPVHDLPHAPRHEHGHDLPRLHLVGQRGRRRGACTRRSRRRSRPPSATRSQRAQPRGRGAARASGPTATSWPTSRTLNPQAQEHAVRRLPRPRLGLPRGLQAGPQGQPARRRGTSRSPPRTRSKFGKAVHLKDIHLEKGMHCVDCHFKQDNHGDGKLYGEPRAAVEIDCIDCHGTIKAAATPRHVRARLARHRPLGALDALRRAALHAAGAARSRSSSMVTEGVEWEVPQVVDTVTPGNPRLQREGAPREDDAAGTARPGATPAADPQGPRPRQRRA